MLEAQNFEYVLSQKEFVGSKINDITVVADRVILVGGISGCHAPAFWVLDTSGQFLYHETLPIKYGYGEITQIAFDSSQGIFHLLGFTRPGDDVGGNSIYGWQLNQNLMVTNERDFIDSSSSFDIGQFVGESFLISISGDENSKLYGLDYVPFHSIELPKYQYQTSIAQKVDSTFLAYFEHSSINTVQLLDWNGSFMDSNNIASFDKLITLQSSFYTVGVDHVIRKYSALDLSLEDSMVFENVNDLDIRTTSSNFIEVISYQEDKATTTYLLDVDLTEVYNFEHLSSEAKLRGFLYKGSYYHAGFDVNDELSYAKKTSITDREFNRPGISILDATITRAVTPVSTTIVADDTLYNFYGTQNALFFELTFENTSDSIITSFAFHTDLVYSFNCLSENVSRFIDGIQLAPGETITISDSTYLHNQISKSNGFSFYVGAPNHWLTGEDLSSYSVDVTTGTFNRRPQPTLFQVFPNPVLKTVTILNDGIPHNANYHVFTTDGKRIASGRLFDKSIPVFDLSPGYYRLQIIANNEVYTSSFVKE